MSWLEGLVQFAQAQMGDREREALWARGVTDEQIDLFRLGCINKRLPQLPYPKDFLEWCWQGRRLDDVFLLPLTNTLGQVKGLQFRHIDRSRSGYSDYLPMKDEPIFFGLSQAMPHVWRSESITLVEGGFDLFPIQRFDPAVVSTLTARLTTDFARLLRRLVNEVWLGYDMDKTGRTACAYVEKTYGKDFRVHTISFPQPMKPSGTGRVKDPSDLWDVWGDQKFGQFMRRLKDPLASV